MKKTFTAEEVDSLENSAYETGKMVGRNEENARIVSIIKSLEAGVWAHKTMGVLIWTSHLKRELGG
jgi:hypothetical protein